ncbi:hypothetical protein CMV_008022 [Castanea mollissima]|uniref:Uncharacterized protein n=1 Tax=Castanea mollissima TaxID=60419 RepID=A0A8J4VPP2_9ROSI|nr:hypothetical protein CMV_008022 [Castanea mollissima]
MPEKYHRPWCPGKQVLMLYPPPSTCKEQCWREPNKSFSMRSYNFLQKSFFVSELHPLHIDQKIENAPLL